MGVVLFESQQKGVDRAFTGCDSLLKRCALRNFVNLVMLRLDLHESCFDTTKLCNNFQVFFRRPLAVFQGSDDILHQVNAVHKIAHREAEGGSHAQFGSALAMSSSTINIHEDNHHDAMEQLQSGGKARWKENKIREIQQAESEADGIHPQWQCRLQPCQVLPTVSPTWRSSYSRPQPCRICSNFLSCVPRRHVLIILTPECFDCQIPCLLIIHCLLSRLCKLSPTLLIYSILACGIMMV